MSSLTKPVALKAHSKHDRHHTSGAAGGAAAPGASARGAGGKGGDAAQPDGAVGSGAWLGAADAAALGLQAIGEVSERDGRGKHTTRHVSLLQARRPRCCAAGRCAVQWGGLLQVQLLWVPVLPHDADSQQAQT